MYSRFFNPSNHQSCFIFGPRGVGKSSWLRHKYQNNNYIDLLEDSIFNDLNAQPGNLLNYIGNTKDTVIIDEVQKIPHLLNEVHRLIEKKKMKFILTGSSARSLRRSGVNLLGGRALTYFLHPLTSSELQSDFNLKKSLQFGLLPMAITSPQPEKFLQSYVRTYIKEEVQLEGLTRNIAAFSRFLQTASFSQASVLNISRVASDCAVERKVVEDYFSILRDLLLSIELPVFTKRAKRELITKSKFFFFDCGVYRAIRPRGPLDSENEINGFSLETLVLQNIRAMNDYREWDYEIFYWHTRNHLEVDLVLYGPKGFIAIEVKSSAKIRTEDFRSLEEFHSDYPGAKRIFLYGGNEEKAIKGITLIPIVNFLKNIENYI